ARRDHSSRCRARFRGADGCRDPRAGKLARADAFSARCRRGIHREGGGISLGPKGSGGLLRQPPILIIVPNQPARDLLSPATFLLGPSPNHAKFLDPAKTLKPLSSRASRYPRRISTHWIS